MVKINKKIVMLLTCILALGIVSITTLAVNTSKSDKRAVYDKLVKAFNDKKQKLENSKLPTNDAEAEARRQESEQLKKESKEISQLAKEVKTQDEYAKELKEDLEIIKLSLEDTKATDDAKTNPKTKRFVSKLEAKIKRIETEFKENKKSPDILLKELMDRSDVDN